VAAIQIGPFEGNLEPDTLIVAAENRLTLRLRNTGMQPCEQIYVSFRCVVIHATKKDWFVPQLGAQEEWQVTFDARIMTQKPQPIKVPLRLQWKDPLGSHQGEADFDVTLSLPQQSPEPSPVQNRSRIPANPAATLRQGLQRLDDVQIETLCLEHFPEVGARFNAGLLRDRKIELLLTHCHRNATSERQLKNMLDRGEF